MTSADGWHVRDFNAWGNCPASCGTGNPTPPPTPTGPVAPQCERFAGGSSQSQFADGAWGNLDWTRSRHLRNGRARALRLQQWAGFVSEVTGAAGPPECVRDCPGIETVVDQPTLGCFAQCAVTHTCVSDCSQTIITLLNSKKANCGINRPPVTTPAPTPEPPHTPTHAAPDASAVTPVLLPTCLAECAGAGAVIAATNTCAQTREWAAGLLGTTATSDNGDPWAGFGAVGASSSSAVWGRGLLDRGVGAVSQEASCIATCSAAEKP